MATPARSLKLAIDFFARVTSGRCPVIRVSSSTALSICRGSATASPTRMFTTAFSTRGTCITFR